MGLTSRIGDTARSLAMKKNFIKIVSLIDNKALSHVNLRTAASAGRFNILYYRHKKCCMFVFILAVFNFIVTPVSTGSDDSSSDDGATLGRVRTPRNRKLNINEGPEALSKMKNRM